ncbi:hypothetical protein Clacol_006967 [Clathrus columnatus]|uniref:Uncharacterized protein n=1 Tax=Clathrus columnatus TaxID=1419009 RepID=A0AAV5AGW1_9AGAM|nr:hypothetical protein Clacol_006967 [Clathrus columnatus]
MVESEEWVTSPDSYNKPKEEILKQKRSHVSQYRATHMQLPLLIATLLKWFPNLGEESEKLGGRLVPYLEPMPVFSGKPFIIPSYPSGQVPVTVAMRRPVFETLVRRLIMNSCKNVRYFPGTVVGLTKDLPNSNAVTGVRIHTSEKQNIVLSATLVVDCTGSAFAGLRWLKELATSEKNNRALEQLDNLRVTYNPKQSYHTCEFDISDELDKQLEKYGYPYWRSSNSQYAILPDPKMDNKLVGILRRDKNTLEILVGGWGVTEEISNIDGIRTYISSIKLYKPHPAWVYKTLDLLEEYGAPMRIDKSRLGISAYIQYHLYDYMPSNFIALGDSVVTLNPIRGFGTTKACMGALVLSGFLDKCEPSATDRLPDDFSKRFWKRHAACIGPNWISYKADDYDYETTTPSKGDNPKTLNKFQKKFGGWLLELGLKEGYNDVAATASYVQNYLAPPTDLFTPKYYVLSNTMASVGLVRVLQIPAYQEPAFCLYEGRTEKASLLSYPVESGS